MKYEELKQKMDEAHYIYDETLATVLYVALQLGRPLLIEGAAGVGKTEIAKVMASSGNFPAIMTDDIASSIAALEGFPTDAQSKEALTVSNLYLEVPYAPNVSEINSTLDSYHGSIMTGELTIDEGIAKMNEEVGKILSK